MTTNCCTSRGMAERASVDNCAAWPEKPGAKTKAARAGAIHFIQFLCKSLFLQERGLRNQVPEGASLITVYFTRYLALTRGWPSQHCKAVPFHTFGRCPVSPGLVCRLGLSGPGQRICQAALENLGRGIKLY